MKFLQISHCSNLDEGEDEAIDPVGVVPAVDLAVDEEVEIEKMALTIR